MLRAASAVRRLEEADSLKSGHGTRTRHRARSGQSPQPAIAVKPANTISVITSWIVLSSAGEYTALPILLAGTAKQYSTKAMPQLTNTTITSDTALNLRWPYHASVMNRFEQNSR